MAIWRAATLKGRVGRALVVVLIVAAGVYAATADHLSLGVGAWREWEDLPSYLFGERILPPLSLYPNAFSSTPAEGYRFLVAHVTITNTGLRQSRAGPVNWELVGSDGVVYEGHRKSQSYVPAMVRRGRVTLRVVFEVPEGVQPGELRLKRVKPAREGQE